jgi:pimeloyl-ACP methyl ester carboxylesterase
MVVDLPGFGRSAGSDDLLSPRAMGEFLVRLVSGWRLHKPHVVAPDIGTPAVLFFAAAHPDCGPALWCEAAGGRSGPA